MKQPLKLKSKHHKLVSEETETFWSSLTGTQTEATSSFIQQPEE